MKRMLFGLVLIAAVVTAQTTDGVDSRREYLSRELDRWEVALPVWVGMLEDPYPLARAHAVQVIASNMDDTRLSLLPSPPWTTAFTAPF